MRRQVVMVLSTLKRSASTSLKSSSSSMKSTDQPLPIKESLTQDQSNILSNSAKQSDDVGDRTETADRRASSWSFGWPARSESPTKQNSTIGPSDISLKQSAIDTDNSTSAGTDIAGDDSSTAIEQDEINKNQAESWISWGRKLSKSQNLSSESLRKLFLDGQQQLILQQQLQQQQVPPKVQPSNELISQPKSVITEDSEGNSIEVKRQRKSSWSFWNATSSAELEDKQFVDDAVLFESSKPLENNTKKAQQQKKPVQPNIIVPDLDQVIPPESIMTKISNKFTYAAPKHLQRTKPKPFKRVLIIGVHGFFPSKKLRPFIGEPTGTSIKFANEAEFAVLRWAKKNDLDISIQKIALEKEGRIFDRVEFFYQTMVKWTDEIRKSDFIFFACHSQGTPVTISLLSRLIETGVIQNDKYDKILGILLMAGVNNGPFYGADQRFYVKAYTAIEHDAMLELFEYQNFDSIQSKKYLESLRIIISNNTKICFVGSIDDQLIPLYSLIASHIEHPNFYRACYVDGGSNTPKFITNVVAISLWLKDIGFTDHGIIKEISNSLAGPLTGGGHSRIYNDPNVYDLGLNFILTTNDLNVSRPQPVHFNRFDIKVLNSNPYHLPWCMRGLIFETLRNIPNGRDRIDEIAAEFDGWEPESKVLKNLKYRLSAIKAKL